MSGAIRRLLLLRCANSTKSFDRLPILSPFALNNHRHLYRTTSTQQQHLSIEHDGSAVAADNPPADGQNRVFSARVNQLVDEIAHLTLLEVVDLNAALKIRLNLPDVAPMMATGMMMQSASGTGSAPQSTETEEESVQIPQKTSFAVKLLQFDETKKIALIKEIKTLIPGLNLVQAKKFVESLPQNVKDDMGKTEAEALCAALAAVGGKAEVV